jgi:GT2 family glycosyltransferase
MSTWSNLVNSHTYKNPLQGDICIGIPTINRKDLLQELLISIDKFQHRIPLSKIIIIDNGNQSIIDIVPPGLKDLVQIYIEVTNLGVSGSWNKMMRIAFEDYNDRGILLLNDDIVIGEHFTSVYMPTIDSYPDAFLINGPYYWSATTIMRECYDTIGKFDEKFFPAYFEDNDYAHRIALYEKLSGDPDKGYYVLNNILDPDIRRNSQTVQLDGSLNSNFGKNGNYFREKWGNSPHSPNLFDSPFNRGEEEPWKL